MMKNRRLLLKLLALLSVITPFAPSIKYLRRSENLEQVKQRVANINELKSLRQINFVFPRTGDPEQDMDPFRQYALILTPTNEVKALSRVCVHLWCLWRYDPDSAECICPCHGSIYNPDTGVATRGPAHYQPYPTNALPMLKVELNNDGDLYVSQLDGIVGYGREWKRDLSIIRLIADRDPEKEVQAYTPFWRPLRVDEVKNLVKQYDLNVLMIYGYIRRDGVIKWFKARDMREAGEKMDWIYSIDILARPDKLLKLAEDDRVIIPLIRGPR